MAGLPGVFGCSSMLLRRSCMPFYVDLRRCDCSSIIAGIAVSFVLSNLAGQEWASTTFQSSLSPIFQTDPVDYSTFPDQDVHQTTVQDGNPRADQDNEAILPLAQVPASVVRVSWPCAPVQWKSHQRRSPGRGCQY